MGCGRFLLLLPVGIVLGCAMGPLGIVIALILAVLLCLG
jgi:hypothetical protein